MQGTPTWADAVESFEIYKKLSADQKRICDETGVLPGKSASKKNPRLVRLSNDKKLAISCIEEIITSTARPGKLSSGGTIYGHWYKDDVTLNENIMSEKKNVRLCPRSGLIPCIRRWLRMYPEFKLIKLTDLTSYPLEVRRLLVIEPKATSLLIVNSDNLNMDYLKKTVAKTMILSPEDLAKEVPMAQQKKVMQAWPIQGSNFCFGSWLKPSLTVPQFVEQVSLHLNSILMEPSKVLKCHELARTIKSVIFERFDGELDVFVTGSLKTGLLTKFSDLDLNVPLPSEKPSFNEVEAYIKIISNSIKNLGMKKMIILHRRGIRVPLIKFDDPTTGVSVDISLGKSTTIFKTKLLAAYAQLDPTVRNLLLFVKSWAAARNINQAAEGTINTYCHSTLLLAYLVMIKAIPNLQRVCARHPRFTPFTKAPFTGPNMCVLCNQVLPYKEYFGFDVYYCDTQITLSCGLDFTQLLAGFMDFMGNSFKSETDAISLRLGALVLRDEIGHPLLPTDSILDRSSRAYKDSLRVIKLLVVEDPIDSSVNVAASGRPWCMDLLNWEFRRCAYLVKLRQPIDVILAPFKQPPPHAYITEGIFKRHTKYL